MSCFRPAVEASDSVPAIAAQVRRSLTEWRDETKIREWMGLASDLMLRISNEDLSIFFASEPGKLNVNSNLA